MTAVTDPAEDGQGAHHTLECGETAIAYRRTPGAGPGVMFLGGFKSDMTGSKAQFLETACRDAGRAFVRFDYSGHGVSGGRFEDGSIGRWAADALAVFDRVVAPGRHVLVGSSMGGWIALLVALARPDRVAGLVGIAPAPDFTEDLIWPALGPAGQQALLRDGLVRQPSDYGPDPYPITRHLLEEARNHLLLRAPIALACPVRLLHGMRDPDVPWSVSLRLAERLSGDDVQVTLIKDGDHRLSRPQDLALIGRTVTALAATLSD